MKTSRFNPKEYISSAAFTDMEKARLVADAIVSRGVDITSTYERWLSAGFALGHALGEEGRQLFHDVSRLHPEYDAAQCDRQYDCCLKHPSGGSPIGLATFFRMAEDIAGVRVGEVMREERGKKSSVSAISAIVPRCQKNDTNNNDNNKYIDNQLVMNIDEKMKSKMALWHYGTNGTNSSSLHNVYTFSDKLKTSNLPSFLQRIMNLYDDAVSRDKMLLGVLNIVSGLLGACNGNEDEPSGIYGIYDCMKVFAPLYNIIYAEAGSGKGELKFCSRLIKPLKDELRRRYEAEKTAYERDVAAWETEKKKKSKDALPERPKEPVYRSPMASGNSSSSAVYHTLDNNGGWALMFETEADTLSLMFKSDYGNYSDLMRKAFHHEPISMSRTTDDLHIDIDSPRLSVLLTCTPGQISKLLGEDLENGLASRFLFYGLPCEEPEFKNVFRCESKSFDEQYIDMGNELTPLLAALRQRKGHPLQFVITNTMQNDFIAYFKEVLKDQTEAFGRSYQGFVFRLALATFRYAMVLSALRLLDRTRDGKIEFLSGENALCCEESDYKTAMVIVETLLKHTAKVYAKLAKEPDGAFDDMDVSLSSEEQKIYEMLPDVAFSTVEIMKVFNSLNLSRRTAFRRIKQFCYEYEILYPLGRGHYIKTACRNNVQQSASASSPGEKRQL